MMSRSFMHSRNPSASRFLSRKVSLRLCTICVILVFSFVVFGFLFCARNLVEDERSLVSSVESKSEQIPDNHLWDAPFSYGLRSCVKPTAKYRGAQNSDHYLTVRCNGGLNQMRTGISDMVPIARIMNATLVIPELDKRSFWHDSSTFSDIFDELHFIETLQGDLRIVSQLPKEMESIPRARKHFTSWGSVGYYEEMTQLWKEYQVIHVAKSDSRLANNDLPLDIQRLRCRVMYEALRFSPPIESLGKDISFSIYLLRGVLRGFLLKLGSEHAMTVTAQKLVERLRSRGGRYIALHLRYEKDMLSFTGCTYGLTKSESEELRAMRENTNHWKVKKINSTEQRLYGFCPLTPKEVGIFLQALGYPSSTVVYIAAGEIYGGNTRLSELTSRFPNTIFKETLATKEELKAFTSHATQSASLDYIISIESDVFVPTYSGNMARAVEGHRRYLGHRKTISPDRKGLAEVFDKLESGELREGSSLSNLVKLMHKNREGGPRKRRGSSPGVKGRARFRTEESFYENPYPECICKSKSN